MHLGLNFSTACKYSYPMKHYLLKALQFLSSHSVLMKKRLKVFNHILYSHNSFLGCQLPIIFFLQINTFSI